MAYKPKTKNPELAAELAKFYGDPLGFVHLIFPWKTPGTVLENESGPDDWQADVLKSLGKGSATPEQALRVAVSSGHGIGKSALVAWIILWFMSTRTNPQIVITANTETQLLTKTWRELAKWHRLALNKDWFEWTATKFYHRMFSSTWFASAIPWTINNAEAFAGTHERDVLMLFDEASAIPDLIWETAEGSMTTKGAMWLAFGNPTRNSGRFRECFGKLKHRWQTMQVDSRRAKMTNKAQINEWVQDYGEDSDFVRVRVRGVFPRSGSKQFIDDETIEYCRTYTALSYERFPTVLGVDIARFGDDETVICRRQGRKVFPMLSYRGIDTMAAAAYAAEAIRTYRAQLAFVEGTGVGGGVVDRLRQLGYGEYIIEVHPGIRLKKEEDYANGRSKNWGVLRDYMKEGLDVPEDNELIEQLGQVEYHFNEYNQILLEKKEDMKVRGLASPDRADALALTFAHGNVVISDEDSRYSRIEMPVLGCA